MKRRKFMKTITGLGTMAFLVPQELWSKNKTMDAKWHVEQFKDKGLAHYSYVILNNKKIIIIDPARDPQQYYDFAKANEAEIVGVIETHPHADFVSAHLEIHRTRKAMLYASSKTKASYPFIAFDEGKVIKLGDQISLRSIDTPGHAPDHISVILQENGKDIAVFSGDALLIGDVGRPDLRDSSVTADVQRKVLAEKMYHTIHHQFGKLADEVIVYPAHGAGSLCGKAIRDAPSSTIGDERLNNYAFKIENKEEFVQTLLSDLPFIPKYFPYNVKLNIKGANDLQKSLAAVKILEVNFKPDANALIIDGREASKFKKSYLKNAVNIQDATKFETWLGSLIAPEQPFYLIAENENSLTELIAKSGKIGYEGFIKGAFVYNAQDGNKFEEFNSGTFQLDEDKYTIIDVRTDKEAKEEKIFKGAINIPLQDLEKRLSEIPKDKPILVNCASGYRSAAGSSLLKKLLPEEEILDFGSEVTKYKVKTDAPGSAH